MSMGKKKHLIALFCLIFAAIATPSRVPAQSNLTSEETAFLKSLNGKWPPDADDHSKWGTWCYHVTLRYLNETVKVSYPASVIIKDKERSVLSTKITDAHYDSSAQCLRFTYVHHILDSDDDDDEIDITVSLTIPFQSDVEDMLLVDRTTGFSRSSSVSEEVIYYRR